VAALGDPGVAAVGPRLVYPDLTLQHEGIELHPSRIAVHPGRGRPCSGPEAGGAAADSTDVAALTGAALLVRRSVFEGLGGFDPRFSLAYNDVDLCLRFKRAGRRCLLVPGASWVHHESATRGPHHELREEALFIRLWGAWLAAAAEAGS
ncbi:MAG: glycosyltransferase, partial [Planctomycetota bacterium]